MKAGRITAPRRIEIIEVPRPVCNAGEATVRLETACLCGSDLPYFAYDFEDLYRSGQRPCTRGVDYDGKSIYPLKVGLSLHECVGTVIESRSPRLKEGDFVLALPFDQTGFVEYLTLPDTRIFPLPKGDVSQGEILLCQPLGTVQYAFRKLPDITGKTVAVVGQGPIGLMMNMMLARHGARRIIGVEKVPERLALSRKTGATGVIDASRPDLPEALRAGNDGELADLVVEAVGHREQAIDLCVDLARQDGWLLAFGVLDTLYVDHFPYGKAFFKNLTITHSVLASKAEHFLPAAEMIANGEVNVSPLLTHRFPAAEAQRAYETFVDRRDGAVKVLIEFD